MAAQGWSEKVERNALPISLGVLALGVAIVAVGVQLNPTVFWDRFVWEDIWGPLVVDANQCRSSVRCPGIVAPGGIQAQDGYTVTSELTYGGILAVLLYGIYVGLFRKHSIRADGWFVVALMPWILLGPVARVLEDANVFCRAGTDCTPGPFAYVFISPVVYIHIAFYVIGAMLLGVFLERRRAADPRQLTGVVASALAIGVAVFAFVRAEHANWFHILPPLWFVILAAIGAAGLFYHRASRGLASLNLTVFVLGLPFIASTLYLVGVWLTGGVWARETWNGALFLRAGATVIGLAVAVCGAVYFIARGLVGSGLEARWAALASRVSKDIEKRLGVAALIALGAALLLSGSIPRLSAFAASVPGREVLAPALFVAAGVGLLLFVFMHVGREAKSRPGVALGYAGLFNLALVFGHMVDGIATWIALADPFNFGLPGYAEKHPFSDFLLGYWGGFLFPVAKLVMVLVIIWLLDREFKESSADERNLVGLVKMAIFVLGFAPGLRDVLRVSMGV